MGIWATRRVVLNTPPAHPRESWGTPPHPRQRGLAPLHSPDSRGSLWAGELGAKLRCEMSNDLGREDERALDVLRGLGGAPATPFFEGRVAGWCWGTCGRWAPSIGGTSTATSLRGTAGGMRQGVRRWRSWRTWTTPGSRWWRWTGCGRLRWHRAGCRRLR